VKKASAPAPDEAQRSPGKKAPKPSKTPGRIGRPPKLTPELQAEICEALEIAVPEKYAAEAVGVSEVTFHEWMRKGKEGAEPFDEFFVAVTRARAKAVTKLTKHALGGEKGSSQAAWFLERRFRKAYGAHVMVGGMEDGEPIRLAGDLKISADLRASSEATKKIHDAIRSAAGTAPELGEK
jgi:hypothetical protein